MKRIRFWGTRGSLPVSLTAAGVRRKIVTRAARRIGTRVRARTREIDDYVDGLGVAVSGTYGGHSSCVEIETGGPDYVLCDLGSGLRPFGQAAIARHGPGSPQTYHIFVSHVHWDHIMGLPFFTPAYIPGNRVRFYGGHPGLEAALRRQQDKPSFPVDFSYLRADIEFTCTRAGQALRHRRHDRHGQAAAPRRRFLRLSLRGGRPEPSSTRPIPSTSSPTRRKPPASSSSSATPTS